MCFLEFAINRYFYYQLDILLSRLSYSYKLETFINEEWEIVAVSHAPVNISFTETVMNPNGSSSNTVAQIINNVQTGFQVNVTLRRHPSFYLLNSLVPIFVLTGVGQTAFALPEEADGKVLVPLTSLLGFMFVQSIAAAEMPHTASAPNIVIYITLCIILAGLTCVTCALCMWLASLTQPLPTSVKVIWVEGVGFLVFPLRWFEFYGKHYRSRPLISNNHNTGYVENYTSETSITNNSGASSGKNGADCNVSKNIHPWLPVAEVLNRISGLGHFAAIVALFFTVIFPLFN